MEGLGGQTKVISFRLVRVCEEILELSIPRPIYIYIYIYIYI